MACEAYQVWLENREAQKPIEEMRLLLEPIEEMPLLLDKLEEQFCAIEDSADELRRSLDGFRKAFDELEI